MGSLKDLAPFVIFLGCSIYGGTQIMDMKRKKKEMRDLEERGDMAAQKLGVDRREVSEDERKAEEEADLAKMIMVARDWEPRPEDRAPRPEEPETMKQRSKEAMYERIEKARRRDEKYR